MPLDRQTQALLEQLPLLGFADPMTQPVAVTRSAAALMRPPLEPARVHLASVDDESVAGPGGPIRVRIYRPRLERARPLPTFVYFHGGGWVLGDLDGFDGLCCVITRAAECVTVSVDYRLAPEHPYPAAVDDCEAALRWVSANVRRLGGEPGCLMVGGDSAGGNLAAVCCLRSRRRPELRIAQQILIYPVTTQADPEFASRLRLADGYFLTRALMRWFTDLYIPDPVHRAEPDASPLLAADLSGLPPALVLTADHDPLVDEGEAYARRLVAAGVPVRARRFIGTIHGFVMFHELLDQGRLAVAEIAHAIRSYIPMGAP